MPAPASMLGELKLDMTNFIAIDTETTGVDPWHGSKPWLITLHDGTETWYWRWQVCPIDRHVIVDKRDVEHLNGLLHGKQIIFQNAKFDVRMLSTVGVSNTYGDEWDWSSTHETLLTSHLLNSTLPKDLTWAALYYLNIDLSKFEKEIQEATQAARRWARSNEPEWMIAQDGLKCMPSAKGKVWKADMWLPWEISCYDKEGFTNEWKKSILTYSLADPEATYMLFQRHMELINRRGLEELYEIRRDILPIAYKMENNGVTVSNKQLDSLVKEYTSTSEKCRKTCVRIAKEYDHKLIMPKTGNNTSLQELIFDKMKLEVVEKTKTGKASLNKSVFPHYLDTLEEKTKERRFIEKLLQKRKVDTALTYIESYKRFMLPETDNYSVLHPTINPAGTATLRCSSRNPNEQNISKKEGVNLRRAFGPSEGREWWALDYNNLELRIPAYECEEPAMLELFEKPNDPPYYGSYHLLIFSMLYPKEFEKHGDKVKDVYKSTLYQWTKNGNFAELYGAVDTKDGKSTADRAFHYPGAQELVARKLRKKAGLNEHWIKFAERRGYVETLPDSRMQTPMGYPLYCKKTKWGKISPTIPLNYHVQGTACWIMMMAMVDVQRHLDKLGPEYLMIMQVHDELVFDFPYKKNKGNLPKINRIRKIMEKQGDYVGVKLTCGVDYHPNNWGVTE